MIRPPQRGARATTAGQNRPAAGLARVFSKLGWASRTVATDWIETGRVAVNGHVVRDPYVPVDSARDHFSLDGRPLEAAPQRYLMLNKPRGLVTTRVDEQGRDTVYAALGTPTDAEQAHHWLAPVGRLDKASEGLLLFTNDPAWAHRLLDPATHLAKVYHVQVRAQLDESTLQLLSTGLPVAGDEILRVDAVRIIRAGEKTCSLEIVLHEGRNRHIRRLFEALDIPVVRLIRIAIGPLSLGALPKGASRPLTDQELRALAHACGSG